MGQFNAVFDSLRAIMLEEAPRRCELSDQVDNLTVRAPAATVGGDPEWFGMVAIKKTYVAYHLMPLYTSPELAADLSDDLVKRRQGKTCFNFRRVDEKLFEELRRLTRRAARSF